MSDEKSDSTSTSVAWMLGFILFLVICYMIGEARSEPADRTYDGVPNCQFMGKYEMGDC